jgi:uncharacterized repeat protein (TIGR03803 family)
MQFTSRPCLPARYLSAALLTVVTFHSPAADTFNPQTQQLLIPSVTIGNATFTNMVVGVTPADILVRPNGTTPFWNVDTYNPANNELAVPAVNLGATTYYNVVVNVGSLISVSSIVGADVYQASASTITIPEVQVGNLIYTDVVATIGSVQSHGGGMPTSTIDVYTPSSHQLAVAAVQVAGTVYTNALVTPGTIKSVGGQLPVESTLYSFGVSSGAGPLYPNGTLVEGADGNFYGTTFQGGANGIGTIFKLTPAGVVSILHSFGPHGSGDGEYPGAGLVKSADGTLYGTTGAGGASGNGTVFKFTPQGGVSVLYSFVGGTDATGSSSLVLDASGNLYGTSNSGGSAAFGAVYKVTPQGAETVLWSFADVPGGSHPQSNLVLGTDGNFYGTTQGGGTAGTGTAFKMTPAGSLTILHSFGATANDGVGPFGGLTLGPDGNFYGTTTEGGTFRGPYNGTVFKMTPAGTVTVLHSFSDASTPAGPVDGSNPEGPLLVDGNGNLYGTTYDGGGYSSGILFKVTPAGKETILYTNGLAGAIAGNTDGNFIQGGMMLGTDGNLYGMATGGGANQTGMVFKLTGALSAY